MTFEYVNKPLSANMFVYEVSSVFSVCFPAPRRLKMFILIFQLNYFNWISGTTFNNDAAL